MGNLWTGTRRSRALLNFDRLPTFFLATHRSSHLALCSLFLACVSLLIIAVLGTAKSTGLLKKSAEFDISFYVLGTTYRQVGHVMHTRTFCLTGNAKGKVRLRGLSSLANPHLLLRFCLEPLGLGVALNLFGAHDAANCGGCLFC